MEKYLITYNEIEVITITEADGGTLAVGTNAIVTTLDSALVMLDALGVDHSMISQKKEDDKLKTK